MSAKAYMKAIREVCGISQADIAAEADVAVRTVKRWEHPDSGCEPPEDVLHWLGECLAEHDLGVSDAVRAITEQAEPGEKTIVMTWYRSQDERDAEGGADVPYTFTNAITRSAAEMLGRAGYEVAFEFPDGS